MKTKTKIAFATAAGCIALGTPVYFQQREIRILKEENAALRESVERAKASTVTGGVAADTSGSSPALVDVPVAGGEPNAATGVTPRAREWARRPRSAAGPGLARAGGDTGTPGNGSKSIRQTGIPATGGGHIELSGDALITETAAPPLVAGKVHWDHSQATGAPDTKEAGDIPTAWAPLNPKSGEQWLALEYDKPVEIKEINIHETHNPGAVSRVAAVMPDGKEKVLWEGTVSPVNAGEDSLETSLPVPRGVTAGQIKVYVDTNRVQSWPEIDAVELVGTNGTRQWASKSSASNSYSQNYGQMTAASGLGAGFGSPAVPASGGSR